ncbi:MAG: response regulator [Chloroflexaceae bacterium]|nr:response regulator [Chloroflexaceae bacterium]NJO07907.1 response regulator [Chloroflexaceae bacterium]
MHTIEHAPSNSTDESPSILVIDDDYFMREMLTVLLEDEGYAVATAAHGREALDYLHTVARFPNLILLDMMMPIMDGAAFRQAQQQDATIASIPVVVLSANGDPNLGKKLGVEAHLPKPIDMETLLQLIRRFV